MEEVTTSLSIPTTTEELQSSNLDINQIDSSSLSSTSSPILSDSSNIESISTSSSVQKEEEEEEETEGGGDKVSNGLDLKDDLEDSFDESKASDTVNIIIDEAVVGGENKELDSNVIVEVEGNNESQGSSSKMDFVKMNGTSIEDQDVIESIENNIVSTPTLNPSSHSSTPTPTPTPTPTIRLSDSPISNSSSLTVNATAFVPHFKKDSLPPPPPKVSESISSSISPTASAFSPKSNPLTLPSPPTSLSKVTSSRPSPQATSFSPSLAPTSSNNIPFEEPESDLLIPVWQPATIKVIKIGSGSGSSSILNPVSPKTKPVLDKLSPILYSSTTTTTSFNEDSGLAYSLMVDYEFDDEFDSFESFDDLTTTSTSGSLPSKELWSLAKEVKKVKIEAPRPCIFVEKDKVEEFEQIVEKEGKLDENEIEGPTTVVDSSDSSFDMQNISMDSSNDSYVNVDDQKTSTSESENLSLEHESSLDESTETEEETRNSIEDQGEEEEESQDESEFEIEVQEEEEEIVTEGVQEQVNNWTRNLVVTEIPAFVPKSKSKSNSKKLVLPVSSKTFSFFPPLQDSSTSLTNSTPNFQASSSSSSSIQYDYSNYPNTILPNYQIQYNQSQQSNWIPTTSNNNQPSFDRLVDPNQHQIMLRNHQILMEQQVIGQQFRTFIQPPSTSSQFQNQNQNQHQYQQNVNMPNQSQSSSNQGYRPLQSQSQLQYQQSQQYPNHHTSYPSNPSQLQQPPYPSQNHLPPSTGTNTRPWIDQSSHFPALPPGSRSQNHHSHKPQSNHQHVPSQSSSQGTKPKKPSKSKSIPIRSPPVPSTSSISTSKDSNPGIKTEEEKITIILLNTIEKLEKENEELKIKFEKSEIDWKERDKVLELNKSLSEKNDKVTYAKVTEINGKLSKLLQENDQLNKEIQASQLEFQQLKIRSQKFESDYTEKIKHAKTLDEEIERLKSQLAEVSISRRDLEVKVGRNELEMIAMIDENKELREILISTESKITKLLSEKDALEYKVKNKDYDIIQFKKELERLSNGNLGSESASKVKITSLESQLLNAKSRIEELELKLKTESAYADSIVDELLDDLAVVKKTNQDLIAENDRLNSALKIPSPPPITRLGSNVSNPIRQPAAPSPSLKWRPTPSTLSETK